MKLQVITDFRVEFSIASDEAKKEAKVLRSEWSLFVNGSSNAKGCGA